MWVVFPTPKFTELTRVADTEINACFEDVCGLIHRTMMTPSFASSTGPFEL